MILEIAILDVRAGREESFEKDFAIAAKYIIGVPGYISHELLRCLERPTRYVLLAKWVDLEAHTVGFRGSPEYQEWKRMLHHYYEPMPVVEHYRRAYESDLRR